MRIVAENPGQLLKRDMFVRLRVHSRQQRTGLLVPVAAVLRDDDNLPFVFVADADGAFLRRRVNARVTASPTGTRSSRGLAAGEKVVADGALFIQFAENQ